MKEVHQGRAVDGNTLAPIPLGLSVQRDGICTFRDDDVGQKARAIAGLVVDFGGSIGGEDGAPQNYHKENGKTHLLNPVTKTTPMPSSSFKKKKIRDSTVCNCYVCSV